MVNTDFVTGKNRGRANGPQRLQDATPGARDTFLHSLQAKPPTLFFDTSTADSASTAATPSRGSRRASVPPPALPTGGHRATRAGLPTSYFRRRQVDRGIFDTLTPPRGSSRGELVVQTIADDEDHDGIQPSKQDIET